MVADFTEACVPAGATIREAMACIEHSDAKIALVLDEEKRLLDTITDGDIRRAILAGLDLDSTVGVLQVRKLSSPYRQAVAAPVGTDHGTLLRLMEEHDLRHVPLLDSDQRVAGLVTLQELLHQEALPLQAVVMAGGYGTRLRPLTEQVPKPMLPVGDRLLLERIIEKLRNAGIRRVNLTTHYKSELIAQHFGDGKQFGVEIQYMEEGEPLGTAGAIGLLGESDSPLLVINGDILTSIDFSAMLDFHKEQKADMTVAVKLYEFQVPYGVIETSGARVTSVSEKPVVKHFINAGLYLLNPGLSRFIPEGQSYDMPDLINRLMEEGRLVVSFPVWEYWLDIGHIEEYQKALRDARRGIV